MTRDISPPPPKRQKTSTPSAIPIEHSADQPPILPDGDTMRIFSWNINGITPFLQKRITNFFQVAKAAGPSTQEEIPPASLRSFLHRHNWPAILFLQEVKIAFPDVKTQNSVRSAVNARLPSETLVAGRGPSYEAHFTLPCDPHNARGLHGNGKVYGVCSIIREDLFTKYHAKVRTVDWDKEGRVSIVELRHATVKLALFNIYAVNGTDSPYRDPATGAVKGTRHDRKLAFHRLLMEECIHLEHNGWQVLLAGDMNVAPATIDGHPRLRTFPQQHVFNRADFNAKFLGGDRGPEGKVFDEGENGEAAVIE
ncbi:hypothetical protein N0V90_005181 [Kalmusia sp. IMI 367209]|nr:hypothetical protein N0V90_005181 [Kalmusia sp. IMI 367209]